MPHTHWDREWYRPFQSFRMQLVDLVDRVLDMLEADPDFAFTLDGQLATIDDYLEIRPEQAERIAGHVGSGRLAIGPWQILMDEFLVSGETLVRNLEMGWARAEDFGGPMRVGYLPDMFGHVAQMPQILRRAGLADAVVWRGIPSAVDRHAFRWEAPDGSWVRAEYLPAGYGNAAGMFAVPDRLDAAARRFAEWSRPWFGDDPVLAMYGTDHTAPVSDLAALVSRLNEVHDASRMAISTLAGYLAAAPALPHDAPRWRGEMRSGARANVLMGVASARIDIKQAAGRAETLLERYAEPLSALHVAPEAWPEPFLRLAWRKVVENSAHDSICGCSIDAVVDQVLVRFAEAEQIATTLTRRAAVTVAGGVPRGALAVLNPSPASRDGVIEAQLLVPEGWESVALELPDGRRLATQELSRKEPLLFDDELRGADADDLFRRFHGREIFDHAWNGYRIDGRTLTLVVDTDPEPVELDVEALRAEILAAMRSAPDETWRVRIEAQPRRTLAASVPLPALGWAAARAVEDSGDLPNAARVEGQRTLANGLLSVSVGDDGTLRLETADGVVTDGVGRVADGGDFGDSYNYGPPASDTMVETPATVSVRTDLAGPVRARLTVTRRYDWPRGVLADGSGRTAETEPTEVVTEVELRAGEPFVRLSVAFENRSDDHRVRFHAPLPRPAETSHAEGQFAVVERGMDPEGGYREEPLATYPAHGWVDAGGLAILLDHLAEYELTDGGRELALTLLRSTGLISRNDNPYRQDPAGPQIAIPNAQMRGDWRMGFALYPHAGDWTDGGVADAAERYRHALICAPGAAATGAQWPPVGAGKDALRLDGEGLMLSSLRRRPDGWLEARVVNLAAEPRTGRLTGELTEAREASLRGEPGDAITVEGGAVSLELGPAEIRTVHVRRRETSLGRADVLDAAGPRHST
ncbi:MAG TPA: glycoside hydrolase family 38 C-terminal domain-containing protein [Methylomirabilota bacterium]|nr:glycoside hydrolase family 38 C-terminal domain-containing protein [Methylomirabilota bacterium]